MNDIQVLEQMQNHLRGNKFNDTTEKAYLHWARSFLHFHHDRDPRSLNAKDVDAFLIFLRDERYATAKTLEQALHAIRCLYADALEAPHDWLDEFIRQRESRGGHNILSARECQQTLSSLYGQDWLVAALIYGAGLRLAECVRLRTRDINFDDYHLLVRQPNGDVSRQALLPRRLVNPLRMHLEDRRMLHIKDIADGFGEARMPSRLADEYPDSGRSWGWQYVFATSQREIRHQGRRIIGRQHVAEASVRRSVERAAIEAGIYKKVSADTLRNSFAVHLIQQGVEVKAIETLLGHGDGSVPMASCMSVRSPLDRLSIH